MAERLTIVQSEEPTLAFAQLAQEIGLDAWSDRMPQRGDQVRHTFDPDDPKKAEALLARMGAQEGRFVGAVALVGESPVGYAWSHDDVSGSPLAKQVKKVLGRRPYAWVGQINVLPERQGHGIGSFLLDSVLEPFDDKQAPTAYVFDENPKTIAWFGHRGMSVPLRTYRRGPFSIKTAIPEPPRIKHIYFGPDNEPVAQHRLVGYSVRSTRATNRNLAHPLQYDLRRLNVADSDLPY